MELQSSLRGATRDPKVRKARPSRHLKKTLHFEIRGHDRTGALWRHRVWTLRIGDENVMIELAERDAAADPSVDFVVGSIRSGRPGK